jgi:hypothetical protein
MLRQTFIQNKSDNVAMFVYLLAMRAGFSSCAHWPDQLLVLPPDRKTE